MAGAGGSGSEDRPKKLGIWLPYRASMTSVTYDSPGVLLKQVRDSIVDELEESPDVEVIEFKEFRHGMISCGEAIIDGSRVGKLDAFVWFGEIGRDYRMGYNAELLRAIARDGPVMNSIGGYQIAMDKFLTSSFLAKNGIPVPRFLLVTSDNAEGSIPEIERWGGSVLLKPRLGSYGIGIVKIDRAKDIVDALDYMPSGTHYVEQMVPNEPGEWIGINIIGGEHAYSYRKGPESFHDGWKVMDRRRIGGKMMLAHPNREQLAIAKRIAGLLDMSWVGVDIITDSSGNPFVIDVNAFPGLYPEMFDSAGIDGARMIADAVLSKLGVQ